MIRALWFLLKVGVLVSAVIWVAERPGSVDMRWMNYDLSIHVGFFLLAMLALILIAIFLYNVIRTFVDFPASYRRYNEIKRREKGYRALTLGLTAVAAGDGKIAHYQAFRAQKFLGDEALPLLLQAQSARLKGDEETARKSFIALLENEDAAFLGVRGLLQASLDAGNQQKALELAEQALRIHPKQPWILRLVYDLQIRARHWADARDTLDKAEKLEVIAKDKARHDRVAMLMIEAQGDIDNDQRDAALRTLERAHKIDPEFVPAAVQLGKLYVQKNKRRKSVSMIEKLWKVHPHPDLLEVWDLLVPVKKKPDPMARLRWYERLVDLNAEAAESHKAVAVAAMDEGVWGAARTHLMKAREIEPDAQIYKLLAALEKQATHNEEAEIMWLEKASEAPPEKTWVCGETGRYYQQWSAIAQPHGAFNTIIWDYPHIQGSGQFLSLVQGALL